MVVFNFCDDEPLVAKLYDEIKIRRRAPAVAQSMSKHEDRNGGALVEAAARLLQAAQGFQQAIIAEQRLREASRKARDLRETVAQLEKIVLDLQTDIRALRDRLNRNGGQA